MFALMWLVVESIEIFCHRAKKYNQTAHLTEMVNKLPVTENTTCKNNLIPLSKILIFESSRLIYVT